MEEQHSSEGIPTRGSPGSAAVTLPPGFLKHRFFLLQESGRTLMLGLTLKPWFLHPSLRHCFPIVFGLPSSDYASVRCASLLSPPKRQSHKVPGMQRLR
jgi:hypothetical protein